MRLPAACAARRMSIPQSTERRAHAKLDALAKEVKAVCAKLFALPKYAGMAADAVETADAKLLQAQEYNKKLPALNKKRLKAGKKEKQPNFYKHNPVGTLKQ